MKLFQLAEQEEKKAASYVDNIEMVTVKNKKYRKVLFTTTDIQLVVMCIEPGEEIGAETHDGSQFIRVEGGVGQVTLGGTTHRVKDGDAIVVPPGVEHNIENAGQEDLKLYAIYSPPEHKDDLVQKDKPENEEH
jgi:mannose-6-phosphate isomerase-like protein (cupin superfamily)